MNPTGPALGHVEASLYVSEVALGIDAGMVAEPVPRVHEVSSLGAATTFCQ